jgi:hypothetical protein
VGDVHHQTSDLFAKVVRQFQVGEGAQAACAGHFDSMMSQKE